MNLSDQEKKLFSRGLIVLGTIILLGVIYFGISRISSYYENRSIAKSEAIIAKYVVKADSLIVVNKVLSTKIDYLLIEIDSLHSIKYQIIINNEKKINTVYSATADAHAKWLESTLNQLTKVDSLQR